MASLYGFQAGTQGRTPLQPLPPSPNAWPVDWQAHWPAGRYRLGVHDSPAGPALVACTGDRLLAMHFPGMALAEARQALLHRLQAFPWQEDANGTRAWLDTWLSGQAPPGQLVACGTAFQQAVWQCLLAIPASWACTYGAIAQSLGKPQAARAVGQAVGQNPLGGWIPCHRVLPTTGLGHYHWGGEATKRALLAREGFRGA